jgi:acyl-CoA synthetase (AMP-forming)/AMP-acid ligase II
MVVGSACIAKSWQLTTSDINLNMMPLFHIGGIARNIFSPVLTGGGVVMCPGFDPALFWQTAEEMQCTWYYASPTMHQGYVEEAKSKFKGNVPKISIRFIANAAGALLPNLAKQMQEVFGATILPGYGMTECMPISAPPMNYKLDRPGTSGRAIGPELKILDGNGVESVTGAVRFLTRNLHSRMPLDPTHVRLKLFHAYDQWHSSRESTRLTD